MSFRNSSSEKDVLYILVFFEYLISQWMITDLRAEFSKYAFRHKGSQSKANFSFTMNFDPAEGVAGRYQVASEIGSAAFSVAYHCVDMQESVGNPNVCLKVIQNSKDFLDQSLDEIKVLQLLQYGRDGNIGHPNSLVSSSHVCDLHHILHLRRLIAKFVD
jgi:hypothetical protein